MQRMTHYCGYIVMVLLGSLSGCTQAPETASAPKHTVRSIHQTITIGGGHTIPNSTIRVEAFDKRTSTWLHLGSTTSPTTPAFDDPVRGQLYNWSLTVTADHALHGRSTPIIRARAINANGQAAQPITYDDFQCMIDELNKSANTTFAQAGIACVNDKVSLSGQHNNRELVQNQNLDYPSVGTTPEYGSRYHHHEHHTHEHNTTHDESYDSSTSGYRHSGHYPQNKSPKAFFLFSWLPVDW